MAPIGLNKKFKQSDHGAKTSLGLLSDRFFMCLECLGAAIQMIGVWCWALLKRLGYQQQVLDFCTNHRGWIVFFTCVPVSFVMDVYKKVRNAYYARFLARSELHEERVKQVQHQVREWNQQQLRGKKLMCTARNPTAAMSVRTASFKSKCFPINCGALTDILSIDEERMIVRTEPLVDMGYMTQYLLPKGYALAIQVEMEDLTIGGLAMGVGMETNSHRLGLLQETIVAYDVILSDGELVHVTADNQYKDLFYALPMSHGTLGFCVALEVKIAPVKDFMHVHYIPCHSQEEYCSKIKELAEDEHPPSFLEATIYSKDKAMIMCGEFANVPTLSQHAKVNHINTWYKPWYYKHVEALLERNQEHDEYIPLKQYYHRYTRSVFWEIEDLIPFSNQGWYRYLFGWLGAPKISLLKRTMTPAIRRSVIDKHVVQDFIIPISRMREAVDLCHDVFEVYPLLVFPIAIFDHGNKKYQGMLRKPENLLPGRRYEMFFDLGAYGVPGAVRRKEPWDGVKSVRKVELFARQCKGYQLLYADTFVSRDEFREFFDHTLYDKMRRKYGAVGAFPEVYDKIVPEVKVPESSTETQ